MAKKTTGILFVGLLSFALVLSACGGGASEPATDDAEVSQIEADAPATTEVESSPEPVEEEAEAPPPAFELSSPSITPGESIPVKYSCDGEDISPELNWANAPEGTNSFALILDDPDAPGGTWVHWVLYNIPADKEGLLEGASVKAEFEDGSLQGLNGWGRADYGGPCPPNGTHRYLFSLYALDGPLETESELSKESLLAEMEGHILEIVELMGTFSRE